MGIDPQILKHREWLGLLQPVGLVVSPLALTRAQAIIDISRPLAKPLPWRIELQARLQELDSLDFPIFTQQILDWEAVDLVPQSNLPDSMTLALPEYGELLQPTYGVKDPDSQEWIVLVQVVADGQELDKCPANSSWNATVQERFERLLRSSQIPTGILWNGEALRLVYAPRGESSGHLTFPLAAMGEVAGRLILGVLDTLLNAQRMFNGSSDSRSERLRQRRLPQILASSRDYQSAVSEQLAEQVVDALWELLRGFQIADGAANGRLLGESPLAPCLVERTLREPQRDSIRNSGGTGMESPPELGVGGQHGSRPLNPPILGDLNPAPPNLGAGGQICSTLPQIPDGVIYRVLDKLLMLDGERLSYRWRSLSPLENR